MKVDNLGGKGNLRFQLPVMTQRTWRMSRFEAENLAHYLLYLARRPGGASEAHFGWWTDPEDKDEWE